MRAGENLLDAARAGDPDAFRVLVEPHRDGLYAHCSRMFGAGHDADDAFQDAMVRAWRGLSGLVDGGKLRPWLYKITTNACFDVIRARQRRALPIDQSIWEEPRTNVPPGDPGRNATPEARYEQRESAELALSAALQNLSGRQRAVLILREVLRFSAVEVAEMLETTVPSVNSTLQRARTAINERIPEQSRQPTLGALGDERLRDVVERFIDAFEAGDVDTILAMLTSADLESKSRA